ncbi:MAG: hypothetical protein ACE5IB_05725 [Candidatus Geothermarchaeales archaeon]
MKATVGDLEIGAMVLAGILLVFSLHFSLQGLRPETFQPLAYLALTIFTVALVVALLSRRKNHP